MKYYELRDDIYYHDRWHLDDIIGVEDNWQFTHGHSLDESALPKDLQIGIYKDGHSMDYTTNGAFSVPIVSERIKLQLGDIKDVQFIPIKIQGRETALKYFILIVTNKVDCVDEKLSIFGKFVDDDPIRPDLAGHYSWFTKLRIDASKTKGLDIFRVDKAENYLIVSDRVKRAIEDINASGVIFKEV